MWLFNNKRKLKSKRNSVLSKPKVDVQKNTEYTNVFQKNLTYDLIEAGVCGLGFIKHINETSVILETADGISAKLSANDISKLFTDQIKTTEATLNDLFQIGQAIAFKVIKTSVSKTNKKQKFVKVTTCPYVLNSHLISLNLLENLVVNGIVLSVEEKGAIIDFGLSSQVKGFVNSNDLPEFLSLNKLNIGQVILLRITSQPTLSTRVINATAFVEMGVLENNKIELNNLTPGTLLMAQCEKITKSGVFVVLNNNLKCFIRNIYLPPRIRIDVNSFKKPIRVCVLICQQNSSTFVISGHPDILSLSKIERRLLPNEYKIGEKINCKVYGYDKQENIYFLLEENENGKVPLLSAKMFKKELNDFENDIKNFSIGSIHLCRIIKYCCVQRIVIVSSKKEILKQKIINANDAKPGEKYTATIVSVRPNCLRVSICNRIKGYISVLHVKNCPIKNWQKGFRKDQKINCQVLYKNPSKNVLFLTAKSALVESKHKIITEISKELIGEISIGVIIKKLETGGFVVAFYNRVIGLIDAKHAEKIENSFIGMAIKVRVKSVNVEKNQMWLDFGEESLNNVIANSSNNKIKIDCKKQKKKITKLAKPFKIYTAKVVGSWTYGGTSSDTSAELLLNGGTIGRLHASELDLTNYETGSKPMELFIEKNVNKTVTVKVICVGSPKTISSIGKKNLMEQCDSTRFVECTLNPNKISETKKKLKLINFKSHFHYGETISAFYVSNNNESSSMGTGEINPLFKMIINLKEIKKANIENGSLILGRIIGINKTNRNKCIVLSMSNETDKNDNEELKELSKSKSNIRKLEKRKQNLLKLNKSDDNLTEIKNELNVLKNLNLTKNFDKTTKIDDVTEPLEKKPKFVKIPDPGFDWSAEELTIKNLILSKNDKQITQNTLKTKNLKKNSSFNNILEFLEENLEDFNIAYTEINNPNSFETWIKSISYFVSQKDYEKAKFTIEEALKKLSFKNNDEIFNIWIIYLNLEVMLGTDESFKLIFERACGATNSLKMHKHLIKILKKCNKIDEANDVFESMLKKFKHDDLEIWYLYGEHLLEQKEVDKVKELLQRAIQSLEKKHHITILSRFAQLEYKYGDIQRGKTMFEKLVYTYNKKILIWNLFISMTLKYEGIIEARKVFERAIDENKKKEKVKQLFKNWLEAEEKYGNLESQKLVQERASKLIEFLSKDETNENEE